MQCLIATGIVLLLGFVAQLVARVLLRFLSSALIELVAFRMSGLLASAISFVGVLLVATLLVCTFDVSARHFVFSLRRHRQLRHLLHPWSFPADGKG